MGQKVNPKGLRLGIIYNSDSIWYAKGRNYASIYLEDEKIRNYIRKKAKQGLVSKVVIERSSSKMHVIIHSARPGMVIGKKGSDLEYLKNDIMKLTKSKEVDVSTIEIRHPEQDAYIVADSIAKQMVQGSYKRAMKKAASLAMMTGAKGIKICCSGRLNGAEIARSEWSKVGRVPLHTLSADVDYARSIAKTSYGTCGVKVWIYRNNKRG